MTRDSFFVYIEPEGRVVVPDWGEDKRVFYVEISPETVKGWPSWLRGMSVEKERIVWL